MNRYAMKGLASEAMDRKRVLIISPNRADLRCALDEAVGLIKGHADVRLSNGREEVRFPGGGFLRFLPSRSVGTAIRGMELDVVFVDGVEADRWIDYRQVWPALVARGGEVVRA